MKYLNPFVDIFFGTASIMLGGFFIYSAAGLVSDWHADHWYWIGALALFIGGILLSILGTCLIEAGIEQRNLIKRKRIK